MTNLEIEPINTTEANLGEKALERVSKIPSENWHKIKPYNEPNIYHRDEVAIVEGYETTLYLPTKQDFKVRLETVRGRISGFIRRMSISKGEDAVLEYQFEHQYGNMAQQLQERLQKEVDPREDEEQKRKKKALQIDLEGGLIRATKLEK